MQGASSDGLDLDGLLQRGETLSKAGNGYFARGRFSAALRHYQEVLAILYSEPRLFIHKQSETGQKLCALNLRNSTTLNTAACFNKLHQWSNTVMACDKVNILLQCMKRTRHLADVISQNSYAPGLFPVNHVW